ncbi:MAG TPA: adenylate/guanylate cyclase domain-containing protein [Stellaceae bacterium]|nr:adenylate/guanylate cyclase domain-containing protein [Stellaceae bacterium]
MTLRLKILSIALALLVVFGIVVGVSAILQQQVTHEVGDVTRYHEPLTAFVADLDVITFEYELVPLRLLRRTDASPDEITREGERADALAGRMVEDFRQANILIAGAIADENLPVASRLVFAQLQGSVDALQRKIIPFINAGRTTMTAIGAGRIDDAKLSSLDFRNYEQAFGPDLAGLRNQIVELTGTTTETIYGKLRAIQLLGFALFGIAAVVGLGFGAIVTAGVVHTLRRLVVGTKAVEAGELSFAVPIRTRDEIGELAAAFNRMVEQLRTKEKIKDTFGKFVDPRIVAGLIEAKADEEDHADRRVVSVFFSDIQGFTSISEQLTAGAMVNLLNHYFAAATRCIRSSNGIVDKYIGDAIMAFWAPPFSPGDTHAESACIAALDQQQAIADLKQDLPNIVGLRRNAPNLVVRMGIATGEVVVGTIGSPVSKSFTVIGDTVNLASRLEGVNKVYGTRIIVSDDTMRLAQHAVEARELDLITVVGKTEPCRIHELLGPFGALTPELTELRETFEAALKSYRQQSWDEAEKGFHRCLAVRPGDGPSAVFVERIATLRREPPPGDWDGVWRLTHK